MARRRSPKNALAEIFEGARRAVFVLDERRCILYANEALCAWLGEEQDDILGTRCDYHSGDDPDSPAWAAGLCPPPEAFAGQTMMAQFVRSAVPRGAEELEQVRRGWCLPLGTTPADCSGVAVFVDVDLSASEEPGATDVNDAEEADWHQVVRDYCHRQRDRYWPRVMVGISPAIQRARQQTELAAGCDVRTILVGPSGSGREFLARAIHFAEGAQSAAPLVPLSCELLDAELLQTTVTAFIRRCAELETERPPALLLLEVDRLPRDAQDDLMGFLSIEELGIRTIATASESPLDMAADQRFRLDLAHAMSPMLITLPALADRVEDVPLLAQYLLEQCNAKGGRQLSCFTSEAMEALVAYPWFGNLRELTEVVAQVHAAADGPQVNQSDLPPSIKLAASAAALAVEEEETIQLDQFLARVESELVDRALAQAKGNKAHAARLLGLNRARFLRRLAALGLADDSSVDNEPAADGELPATGLE